VNLIPARVYVILAALLAAIVGLAFFAWHERELGAQAIRAADIRVAAARQVHDIEVEDAVKDRVNAALAQFQADRAAPLAPAPAIVCTAAAPRANRVPDHGGSASGSDGAPAVPEESTGPSHATFDPAPAVIRDAADADAQIELLQSIIRSYQQAGVVKKK
jgi:hypothetical protein